MNGTPSGFFQFYRGLHQGDLLSPLLFILIMEALSRMLYRVVQGGLLEGFEVSTSGREQFSISHILYPNDTLVFCGAKNRQLC